MPFNRIRTLHPLLLALLAFLLFRLITLGLYPLMDTTEARYGEIGRKMAELGDWITPWIEYDKPFWGKPPLSFWLTAASFKLFSVNEFTARLPHFFGGLVILWLVWNWLVRHSRQHAYIAVTLLSGSALFFISAGAVMTDMTLAIGTTLAMRGFWLGLHGAESDRNREPWLFFLGVAIGLLAKGPLALVLIGTPITLWTMITKSYKKVWQRLPWIRGILFTLLLSLPWYLLAEHKTPGFLDYFIVGEHWHRFVTSGWKGDLYGNAHAFPRGSIWIFAIGACLPWALLLPIAGLLWRKQNAAPAEANKKNWFIYLTLWGITPCLFFTFAGNILWTYVLPALPALAILASSWLMHRIAALRINQILITGLTLMTLVFSGFIINIKMNPTGDVKTTKALILDYQTRKTNHEPLIFLGRRPQSAAFYSSGKAGQALETAELSNALQKNAAFVAIRTHTPIYSLPPELQAKLKPVATHGDYTLYFSEKKE